MQDGDRESLAADLTADLQQAAGVRGQHDLGPGADDVFDLAADEAIGHFGLVQIVGARRPAADFRLRQIALLIAKKRAYGQGCRIGSPDRRKAQFQERVQVACTAEALRSKERVALDSYRSDFANSEGASAVFSPLRDVRICTVPK